MKMIRILLMATAILCSLMNPVKAQVCSSPLNGGTLVAYPQAVCPYYYFSLQVSGSSSGSGLSYQWESSTDNASWIEMPGVVSEKPTLQQTATTWYRRKIICDAGGTAYSNSFKVVTTDFNTCYCTPGSSDCSYYNITNVKLGTLNNTSSCSGGGYTNYSSTVGAANVTQGSYLPISVTASNASNSRLVICYIDFDQNGQFDPKEGTLLFQPAGNIFNGNIKVPYHTPLGMTRMRILYRSNTTEACGTEWNGETEDYAVNLIANNTGVTGHVIYVKPTAPGSNNSGLSWANALTSLRDALQMATAGDTIKVAEGSYYSGYNQTNGLVLDDSLTLLGGYPASGTPVNADRNSGTHPVILSGYKSSTNTAADYHVFFASGIKDCTVDGFIIQDGGTYYSEGSQYLGGGINVQNSTGITIRNCIFKNNYPYIIGTAISVSNAAASFENCIVTKNTNDYYSIIQVQNNSQVSFTNLLATGNGGSFFLQADSSTVTLKNSTLARNTSTAALLGIFSNSHLNVINSISFYNQVYNAGWQSYSFDSTEVRQERSAVSFRHSLTQVYNKGSNLQVGVSPKFRDTSNVRGSDGFYFTSDDGFSLVNPCSPAMNAGSNADTTGIIKDITGSQRVFGTGVDLGAYEVQQNPSAIPKVIYVNAAATGANNGSSWANAYTDLHKALQMCSDTIKVAAGSYTPWKGANSNFYWLENKRVLFGAFPASGNPSNAERDYEKYATVIEASTNTYEKAIALMKGLNLDSTSILDGFTFSGAGRQVTTEEGALVYRECSNPIISNCSFTGNTNRVFYGKNNKNPLFINCTIYNNSTSGQYAYPLVSLANSEKTTFRKCVFRNNNTLGMGIMTLVSSRPLLDSCLFLRNSGTMLSNYQSAPTITNTAFINNYGGESTTDVYNEASSPVFNHCIFKDTAWAYATPHYGGISYNHISSPVFNNCQFYNGRINQFGGVAFNDSSLAKYNNCVFANNMNPFYNANNSHIELTNCISYGGSGWYSAPSFMYNMRSSPVITNCTVVNGTLATAGVLVNDYGSNPVIDNTIFWRNFINQPNYSSQLSLRVEVVNRNNSNPVIRNSMFEVFDAGSTGNNTTNVDPRLKNYENPMGLDSTWFTADDGLRLCDCSSAINSGNNMAVKQTVDITGQPRIFSNTVDRGAYELAVTPAVVPSTSYVDASANGNKTGADWANAYTSLQGAVQNPCTDTIKIAAGLYKPAMKNRDSGFYINRNLVLLGSYDVATGDQDVDAHPSIISGDLGVANDNADNSYGLFKAYYLDTLILNGIVVQDAHRSMNGPFQFRGGLDAQYINLLSVVNCRFNNNITNLEGGALFAYGINKIDLRQNVFSRNKAIRGGGLYFNYTGVSPTIYRCIFEENEGVLGGGIFTGQSGAVYSNTLFLANKADKGGAMLLDNNPDCIVVNCTFSKNYSSGNYGCGIYSEAYAWQGGGAGPDIGNCIFTDNSPSQSGQNYYQDIYYPKYGYPPGYYGQLDLRIHHSATSTTSEYYYGNGMISPGEIVYKNKNNPIGADGKWFTADDGYQLSACSGGVDKGLQDLVKVDKDLAANSRMLGVSVDMGSYEFSGQPEGSRLLDDPGDTLLANKEFTDTLGWTHYYKDCIYLMSIKKEGQDIGKVGDGTFKLQIVTTPDYGTGKATNLTNASYNTTGDPWYVMNRYWNVLPTHPVSDSILVSFPFTAKDYKDVAASNPTVQEPSDMWFFKVTESTPFDLSVPASRFTRYQHAAQPSLHSWNYEPLDSNYIASYYVQSFSGGGGGAWYDGPLPDLVLSAATPSKTLVNGGGALYLNFIENNGGAGSSSSHQMAIYLSLDSLLTPGNNGDSILLWQSLPALPANSSRGQASEQFRIPCHILPGQYYLFLVTDAGNHLVEANENNNASRVTIEVGTSLAVPAVPLITGPASGATCYGTSVTLAVNESDCPSCTYTWSTGSTGSSLNTNIAGNYTVTAANGCGSALGTYSLTVNPLPYITVTIPQGSLCLGTPVALTANGADSYTWTGEGLSANEGTSVNASPSQAGNMAYSVIGTKNGCTATKSFSLTILPIPTLQITPANPSICSGGSVTLTASGATDNYSWTPATGLDFNMGLSVVAKPMSTTTYTVTGKTNGCAGSVSTTVSIAAPLTPAVSITNNGCTGNSTRFSAVAVNGGTNPSFQWYVNNTPQGTGSTLTLDNASNGTQVFVKMTAGTLCLTTPTATSQVETVNCTTTAIPVVDGLESFGIAPNPSSGRFTLSLKLLRLQSVSFTIRDANGKVVYQAKPLKIMGSYRSEIHLLNAPQGLYYLETMIGNEHFVEKLMIIR